MKRTGKAVCCRSSVFGSKTFLAALACSLGLIALAPVLARWPCCAAKKAHAGQRLDAVKQDGREGLKLTDSLWGRLWGLKQKDSRGTGVPQDTGEKKILDKGGGGDLESTFSGRWWIIKWLPQNPLLAHGQTRLPLVPLEGEAKEKPEKEIGMIEITEPQANVLLGMGFYNDSNTRTDEVRVTMRFRLPY